MMIKWMNFVICVISMAEKEDQSITKSALIWFIDMKYNVSTKTNLSIIRHKIIKNNLPFCQTEKQSENEKCQVQIKTFKVHIHFHIKGQKSRIPPWVSVPVMFHNTWTRPRWRNRSEGSKKWTSQFCPAKLQTRSMTVSVGALFRRLCESQHISDGNMGKFPLNCV